MRCDARRGSVEHLATFIRVSSVILSIIDGGAMILFLIGAATFRPNRTGQREGVFICLILAGVFGAGSLGRAVDAYMGGSFYYASTMPRDLWPLVVFGGVRFIHTALGVTLWVWTLKRFRRYRIDAASRSS